MNSETSDTSETIEPRLREILRCPHCKGVLSDDQGPEGRSFVVPHANPAYPISDGVPVLLVDLARRTDT